MASQYERQSAIHDLKPAGYTSGINFTEEPDSALILQRQQMLRSYKSGRCPRFRKRLNAMFQMRRYYRAVMGLTGIEAILVLIRLILETESLRFPPGHTQTALHNTSLALLCISLPTLLLFVIEQPFKWWAFGSQRFCKSVLLILDSVVCMICLSLNIYNIHSNVNRPQVELASARQLELCGVTHITGPPDTGTTFALVSGFVIVYRLWCISGYIHKSILKATRDLAQKLLAAQHARDDAELRFGQLQLLLREQRQTARTPAPNSSSLSSSNRTPAKRPTLNGRNQQESGQPV
ncbi:hypothetical protein T265_08124 [Opisthorchis viverrini]|uniref:Voltage-gated hydrogen channel 1 n=1 Tax=Opisthorchis viverrini TaxID=6198 RepID=A0A074ZA55_OPIVI|nr:hypothetical protein T265_08124 [Opisthorchis viverrini]KER24136.1 hypothetical protein T265_08124 [Opisthorchis viverrini]